MVQINCTIRAILSEILPAVNSSPPSPLAGSLEGKLNSFCQLYFPAKPAIQPISARHHKDNVDEDGEFLLHDELRVSLDYLDTIFASGPLVTWFRVLPDPNPPSHGLSSKILYHFHSRNRRHARRA